MKNIKNEGHFLIEVLFSIILIAIVSSVLIPNFISILNNNSKVNNKKELVNFTASQIEEIIAYNYEYGEIKILSESDKYEVSMENFKIEKYNHVKIIVKDRKTNEECKMEIVLPQERLYSN